MQRLESLGPKRFPAESPLPRVILTKMTKHLERCKRSGTPVLMTQFKIEIEKNGKWKDGLQTIAVYCPECFNCLKLDLVVENGVATGTMTEHQGVVGDEE